MWKTEILCQKIISENKSYTAQLLGKKIADFLNEKNINPENLHIKLDEDIYKKELFAVILYCVEVYG